MSRFRFSTQLDIALLTEVQSQNPFLYPKPKLIWTNIADALRSSDFRMNVTQRTCKERFELLMRQFDGEEWPSKRSGVSEEELTQLSTLLLSIKKLQMESFDKQDPLCTELVKKEIDEVGNSFVFELVDVDEAQVLGRLIEDSSDQENENECVEKNDDDELPQKKMKLDLSSVDTVSYLTKKLEVQKDELKVRHLEAENRREEIKLQAEKFYEERKLAREKFEFQKEQFEWKRKTHEQELLTQSMERKQMLDTFMQFLQVIHSVPPKTNSIVELH